MKRIIIISIIIMASIITSCSKAGAEPFGDKVHNVGDLFSSTLVYAGYIPTENILVFGDWFNKRGNLFVAISENHTANFYAYNDLYELSEIKIGENVLICNVTINGK